MKGNTNVLTAVTLGAIVSGLGLVSYLEQATPAAAAPTRQVQLGAQPGRTSGGQRVERATDEEVAELAKALKNDPLLDTVAAVQELMSGRVPLTQNNLGAFLAMTSYPTRKEGGIWWGLDVPYRGKTLTVHVAVGDSKSALWIRLDLRKFDAAAWEHTRHLQTLLGSNGVKTGGSYWVGTPGVLSLLDRAGPLGMTQAKLRDHIARLVGQAEASASEWRG